MTTRRAERLTGYEVRLIHDRDGTGKVVYGAFAADELIAEGAHRIDGLALDFLVREVYRLHSFEALRLCEGRCTRCRKPRRLQIHHSRYRSHGGTHRIENLEPVCWDCHRIIHQLERSK